MVYHCNLISKRNSGGTISQRLSIYITGKSLVIRQVRTSIPNSLSRQSPTRLLDIQKFKEPYFIVIEGVNMQVQASKQF